MATVAKGARKRGNRSGGKHRDSDDRGPGDVQSDGGVGEGFRRGRSVVTRGGGKLPAKEPLAGVQRGRG